MHSSHGRRGCVRFERQCGRKHGEDTHHPGPNAAHAEGRYGGGASNGLFFRAGLIDELSVVIYAGVDGLAGMPTILDSFGTEEDVSATRQSLELLGVRQLDNGSVWLRYTIHPEK